MPFNPINPGTNQGINGQKFGRPAQVKLKMGALSKKPRTVEVGLGLGAAPAVVESKQEAISDGLGGQMKVMSAPKIPLNVVCDLCRSPYREDVEARMRKGEDIEKLGELYGVSTALIRKHMTHLVASLALESTIQSLSDNINVWRERQERLFAGLTAMYETIQSGLIERITPEGESVLSQTTILHIKPTLTVMVQLMKEARMSVETFARINGMFQSDQGQGGPVINIVIPGPVYEEPVTLDLSEKQKVTDDIRSIVVDGSTVNNKLGLARWNKV